MLLVHVRLIFSHGSLDNFIAVAKKYENNLSEEGPSLNLLFTLHLSTADVALYLYKLEFEKQKLYIRLM